MANPPTSQLSPQELAALDVLILSALQAGKGLDEKMSFIDAIVHAVQDIGGVVGDAANQVAHGVADAAHAVGQGVQAIADHAEEAAHVAAAVAEIATHLAEAGMQAEALDERSIGLLKSLITTTAKLPTVTLEQLIEIRRRAVSA